MYTRIRYFCWIYGVFAVIIALRLPTPGVADEPDDQQPTESDVSQGDILRKAVADLSEAIEVSPRNAEWYDHRGAARFKLNDVEGSIADFDRAIEWEPKRAAGHWMRGISLYYAGRYAEGAEQFDAYQAVSTNDVENSVWWYICAARDDGHEKARAGLLPVGLDRRIPLMEVFALFQDKQTPEDVLAAIDRGEPDEDELLSRRFYGHLYLALYHESHGDLAQARRHIDLAAGEYHLPGYMGHVARIHALRMTDSNADAAAGAGLESK